MYRSDLRGEKGPGLATLKFIIHIIYNKYELYVYYNYINVVKTLISNRTWK